MSVNFAISLGNVSKTNHEYVHIRHFSASIAQVILFKYFI